jgi:hypothetical protein
MNHQEKHHIISEAIEKGSSQDDISLKQGRTEATKAGGVH